MRIAKASVSCEIDDIIKASLELIGQNVTPGTSKIADATYTDHVGAVAFNETTVTIGGDNRRPSNRLEIRYCQQPQTGSGNSKC